MNREQLEKAYPDMPGCTCTHCKADCAIPCWPLPSEALAIIEAGYGAKLMLDWSDFVRDRKIWFLSPALPGFEGKEAPENYHAQINLKRPCVMQDKQGLCTLHKFGLKPKEGRATHHTVSRPNLRRSLITFWNTVEGQMVVERWQTEFMIEDDQ